MKFEVPRFGPFGGVFGGLLGPLGVSWGPAFYITSSGAVVMLVRRPLRGRLRMTAKLTRLTQSEQSRSKRGCLSLHRAVFGVGIAVVREYLLDDLGLVFAVRPLGHLGQIEVLNRIVVVVELISVAKF